MKGTLRRGTRIGKYQLVRRLGRGGFAEVWRATDTVENRPVALKITAPEAVQEWGREPIEHEARIATRLQHPNIVSVRNADWVDGRFVMATDLGLTSLADYKPAHRSGAVALRVIRDTAAGLAYAHARRVMHRDLKPENILILPDGRAALCDFGVSRFAKAATATYTEAGTLGYMAPEQAYGRPKLSSDVFSLGMIAYEILTGYLPAWPFDWPFERHERFARKVPGPVQAVLRKAAQFDPRRRYADAGAFHRALEAAFRRVEEERPRPPSRRRKPSTAPPSPLAMQAGLFKRLHGKALDLRYGCRRCGGPISEPMTFCPWCGTSEQSFLEVSGFPLVCPECERGVRPEWDYCPWCYKGRFESNGRKPPRDPKAVRTCTTRGCDGQLRRFMRYCPRCKRKPARVWKHPDLPDRCPRCRWPVSHRFWRFCAWCGRREPRAGAF